MRGNGPCARVVVISALVWGIVQKASFRKAFSVLRVMIPCYSRGGEGVKRKLLILLNANRFVRAVAL